MSTLNHSKINLLLRAQPPGTVLTSAWLAERGYGPDLQKRYRRSQWFDSAGPGALIRCGDEVDYLGGVYALQTQLGLSVHPAGKTALSLQGWAHYLELAPYRAWLFGAPGECLPRWFRDRDWGMMVEYKRTGFLPPEADLVDFWHKGFALKVSGPVRAMMECLYLTPQRQPMLETYELMEGLGALRPEVVQELLENCASVKVKRLFLYLAEKAEHRWLRHLDLDRVDLGSGKRSLASDGAYVPKYRMTISKDLHEADTYDPDML